MKGEMTVSTKITPNLYFKADVKTEKQVGVIFSDFKNIKWLNHCKLVQPLITNVIML